MAPSILYTDEEIAKRVEKIAKDKGVPMSAVAIAWVLSKGQAPIVGLSSEKRIKEAVDALKVKLTPEDIKFLEEPYQPKPVVGWLASRPVRDRFFV
ncbi:hypothetical protein AURDEDRAFT_165461 [Auricularia subglabra TFB-10046 SS5]|nr:hypothetical protein AURDEDRAFT_165461 [Auricularia subglabra TFB-10046 SS5]